MVPDKSQNVENIHFTWCGYIDFKARCYVKYVTYMLKTCAKLMFPGSAKFGVAVVVVVVVVEVEEVVVEVVVVAEVMVGVVVSKAIETGTGPTY